MQSDFIGLDTRQNPVRLFVFHHTRWKLIMAHSLTGSNTPRNLDNTKTYLVVDDFETMR